MLKIVKTKSFIKTVCFQFSNLAPLTVRDASAGSGVLVL